ncbi:MAG: ABC transporter ATP-binding protein [Oscillospiraceae bacterium]|jgi:peptide/nickel transport system ATP-binding protein|nr:ABC transporter ATP-binding protein [Oscillospiraceae bacterium]
MDHLLDICGLRIETRRGGGKAMLLDKVDLSVKKGQSFGIVGESGCGKSITANALMQLLPYPLRVSDGTARYQSLNGEKELLSLPAEEIRGLRGREIAMIFQEPMTSLDPIFTVEYQMFEALSFHNKRIGKREMHERALEMLRSVKIPRPEQTLRSYPHLISGGQLQRVMIAMAMLNNPRLLIADEPTTALDVTIQAQILELMNGLKAANGTSIIMITHDLGVIAETCEEVAVFYAGQVVEQAPAAELFHNTAHPYTEGLLRAVTSLDGDRADMGRSTSQSEAEAPHQNELYTIPGMVPPGGEWSSGCRFRDRCDRAAPRCAEALPALCEIAPGHLCRCFRTGEEVEAR